MNKFREGHFSASKLTPEDVFNIRQRYAAGETQAAIARDYPVTTDTIGRIVRGESWKGYGRLSPDGLYESIAPAGAVPEPTAEDVQASLDRLQKLQATQQAAAAARRTMTEVTERARGYGVVPRDTKK